MELAVDTLGFAHMYPDAGPAEDCESDAERKLYRRFRQMLGPDFHVIHSVKWNAIASNGRMQPGEADFIVIHPTLGIAVLEVKGGRVSQHPKTSVWYTIDRFDKKTAIRDPFTQAMRSAKTLERKLRDVPFTAPYANQYRICYGVWFPDIPWERDGRGALRMLDEQVLDKSDMRDPRTALTKLLRFAQGTTAAAPLSDGALDALIGLLFPNLTVVESPLSGEMRSAETTIKHLTREQSDRLTEMWSSQRQMVISGHAGTGKTVMALEMAWRLAKMGQRVLVVCANRTLAEHLRQRVSSNPRTLHPGFDLHHLEIRSLAELVDQLSLAGRVRSGERQGLDVAVAKDQATMASILAANLDALERRGEALVYDAVLVDEAQDINQPMWPPLRRLLRPSDDPDEPAASSFYVFYDPVQRDLPGEWDPAWTGIDVTNPPLTVNCRNTAAIYELMGTFNPKLKEAPFRGPQGRPVSFRSPDTEVVPHGMNGSNGQQPMVRMVDAETVTLEAVLNELVEREGVRPDEILVVTGRTRDGKNPTRWRLTAQQDIGRRSLEWIKPVRSQIRIALATIRSSKGLESPVVVLAELDGVAGNSKHDQLLYTAISRAKHQLIVLASPEVVAPKQPGWWEALFKGKSTAQPKAPQNFPGEIDPFIGPNYPDDPNDPDSADESSTRKSKDKAKDKGEEEDTSGDSATSDEPFVPSDYQRAIFDFIRAGRGNGIVSAVAGSGKTSTLVEAANYLDTRNALFLAFNKHIEMHLNKRLRGTCMTAKTIHSVGLSSLSRYFGRDAELLPPDERKYNKLCRAWVNDNLRDLDTPGRQQASEALFELVDLVRKTLTSPKDAAAMRQMASHFSVECDAYPLEELFQAVPRVIEEGERLAHGDVSDGAKDKSPAKHIIDFTDMVYLPHLWNLPARWHADWVFVDEAQDLNAAQLVLALKCCGPHGRMLFVGDRHQAIYGFSGADSDAFDHIKRTINAVEFPLSDCFRCPTSHIALAKELVPEIQPTKGAVDGELHHVTPAKLPKLVQKGDLVLGRKTAPLIELCIKLMQSHIFAQVKGRDIGKRITLVVQEVTRVEGYTWKRFGHFLEEYQRQQEEKISQFEDADAELVRLGDRVAAVRVCYEMFEARDAGQICRKIDELFKDEDPDVQLSTIHRAKGLEADRVFLLEPDEMPLHWPNQQTWEVEQERNIKYVGLTRAKQTLYLVDSPISSS